MNSYDLGVDIELYDAVQRLRFEHPEVQAVVVTSGKDRMFCAGRQHPDARAVLAPVEGELLQVHQRDPQRHRGRHRALRPDLDRRGQRHRGRRRLRAGAGLRPDPAGRRQLLHRLAARGAAAGRAARHRRPHPRGRQAARAQGPRRRVRHQAPRASAASRPSSGGWSTRSIPKRQLGREGRASAPRPPPPAPPARPTPPGSRSRRCSARRPTTASRYRARRGELRPGRGAGRTSPSTGRRATSPTRVERVHELGADFWPLAMTRELDDLILRLRANELELGTWVIRTKGDDRERAGLRRVIAEHSRVRLAGQRDPPLLQARAQAARRHLRGRWSR